MITTIDSKEPVKAKNITVEIDGLLFTLSEDLGRLAVQGHQGIIYISHSTKPNELFITSDRVE